MSAPSSSTATAHRHPAQSVLTTLAVLLLGSALLALSAYIQIPFAPVKPSLQTLVVLAFGVVLGSRLAAAVVLAYLVEGALGLPVFQSGGGLAYFMGPTAGYLVGFVAGAFVVGWILERAPAWTPGRLLVALAVGEAAIYLPGVLWLGVHVGASKAIALGVTPFVFAEILKVSLIFTAVTLVLRHIKSDGGKRL